VVFAACPLPFFGDIMVGWVYPPPGGVLLLFFPTQHNTPGEVGCPTTTECDPTRLLRKGMAAYCVHWGSPARP
jgi:hypothetical protein